MMRPVVQYNNHIHRAFQTDKNGATSETGIECTRALSLLLFFVIKVNLAINGVLGVLGIGVVAMLAIVLATSYPLRFFMYETVCPHAAGCPP
jgi:hypothetical protein